MRPAAVRDDESGVTMIELVVSLTIMAVMMTVFTTAVVQMYQAANKTESMSNAQSELNNVFLRMDRIVRYATGISKMQQSGDRYYIGMLVAETGNKQRCYALQLTGGTVKRLQIASWYENARPTTAPWTTIANDVDAPPIEDGEPFTVYPADATNNFDRLQLNLVANVGSDPRSGTKADTKVRFTALNTSLTSSTASTATVCTYFWSAT